MDTFIRKCENIGENQSGMENEASTSLCNLCNELFEEMETANEISGGSRLFHDSSESLQNSLDAGCPLCAAISHDTLDIDHNRVSFQRLKAPGTIELRFKSLDRARTPDWLDSRFVLCNTTDGETLLSLSQQALMEDYTGSDHMLDLAREWMRQCIHDHEQCTPNLAPSFYPPRLLDIRNDVIRLLEGREHRFSGPYATLSHSWGHAKIKVLTSQNLSDFRNGIHIGDIPPTFRDTISVVRRLDISYLWIDCYCIIQSEATRNEDQQQEIAAMGKVYINAVVNIGAAMATSPLDGCFTHRNVNPPTRINFTSRTSGVTQSYLLFNDEILSDNYLQFIYPESSSIFRRAWCMQERFLSSRMLHFCKSGVFWECEATRLASDVLPIEHLPAREMMYRLPPFSAWKREELPWPSSLTVEWGRIVEAYTAMELSWATKDKFAACAGVAQLVAGLLDDHYVAGFFFRDLIPKLTWARAGCEWRHLQLHSAPGPPAKRAKHWRAPTWSWASMDGSIEIMDPAPGFEACATVISAHCNPTDPLNLYGALASARITVKGYVSEVKVDGYRDGAMAHIWWGDTSVEVVFDDADEPAKHLIVLLTMISTSYMDGTPRAYGLILARVKRTFTRIKVFRRVGAIRAREVPRAIYENWVERVVEIV